MRVTALCLFIYLLFSFGDALSFKTPIGTFLSKTTLEDSPSVSFLGIPFAQPIDQTKRWTVPTKPEPGTFAPDKVFDATKFGFRCPQKAIGSSGSKLDENCLFLNIFAPQEILLQDNKENNSFQLANKEKLPVMIFIHGGAFSIGSAEDVYIKPEEFNANGVILVSINYRLGFFGFFPLPEILGEDPAAENFGLLDQRLAISWVIDNIHHFGGDAEQITLFGESAGAMSILWHLSANEENVPEDLKIMRNIKNVIIQSAPNLDAKHCLDYHESVKQTMSIFGCDGFAGEEYLNCLRSIDADTLVDNLPSYFFGSRKVFFHTRASADTPTTTAPCVDHGIFNNFPRATFDEGKHDLDTNIIIGTTRDEGTLFSWLTFLFHSKMSPKNLESFIHAGFFDNDDDDDAVKIIKQYLDGTSDDLNGLEVLPEILNDIYFQCGNRKYADQFSSHNPAVYRYVFSHFSSSGTQFLGVYHASELVYIFGTPVGGGLFPSAFTDEEKHLSKVMNKYWSNFAKFGNPMGNESDDLPMWPAYDPVNRNTQILNATIETVGDYKSEICQFWESIYPEGVPLLGVSNEMMHEHWYSYAINETGYLLVRNYKIAALVGVAAFALVFSTCFYCFCKKSKSSSKKKKVE